HRQRHPGGPPQAGVALLLVPPVDPHEVRQVGGQHGEPAGVHRGDHPDREVVGDRTVAADRRDHAPIPRCSSICLRSLAASSLPVSMAVIVPSALMNTVVGMATPLKNSSVLWPLSM